MRKTRKRASDVPAWPRKITPTPPPIDLAPSAESVAAMLDTLGFAHSAKFARAVPRMAAVPVGAWQKATRDTSEATSLAGRGFDTNPGSYEHFMATEATAKALAHLVFARREELRGDPFFDRIPQITEALALATSWRDRFRRAQGAMRANPVRSIANVATEKRANGYYYRDVRDHLIGPFATKALAEQEGVLALAGELAPGVPRRDLFELAGTLAGEDRTKAHAKRFSDGWRVWKPTVGRYVGGEGGAPFATRAEADAAILAASGRPLREAPLFGRVFGPDRPAPAAPAQLGLFGGTRGNPTAFAPLRGSHGEAVTYRVREDGTVIVRSSHPGAGMSEREMDVEGASRHRAKLLGMGYRPNPGWRSNPRAGAKRRRPKAQGRTR